MRLAALNPILDLQAGDGLEVLVGREQGQLVLTSNRCDEKVELGKFSPSCAQFAKNLAEGNGGRFIGRPKAKYAQRLLQPSEVSTIVLAEANSCAVLAEHRQADAEPITRAQRGIDSALQHGLPVEVGR